MKDAEVDRLARARIGPKMEERRRLFFRQVQAIDIQVTSQRPGDSRARAQATQDACEREAEDRAWVPWNELRAVLAATGVRYTVELTSELNAEVKRHLVIDDLVSFVNSVGGDEWTVRGAAERALKMISSEIDLYGVKLKRLAEEQGRIEQTIYNFVGPVGAVQTGAYSTATVVQQFDTKERQSLKIALDELHARVVALEVSALPQKEDVLELINDARAEVDRERPNRLRLGSTLSGIGTVIQTVGAAEAAYHALKIAAAMIGITLP